MVEEGVSLGTCNIRLTDAGGHIYPEKGHMRIYVSYMLYRVGRGAIVRCQLEVSHQ